MWDKAPPHVMKRVEDWIADFNLKSLDKTFLIVAFIEGGLTSILQPCDVIINKPFKQMVKKEYINLLRAREGYMPGDKVKISRDDLINVAEQAVKNINLSQLKNRTIAKAFDICGINPWADDLSAFDNHIKSLKECKVYETLMDSQLALDLGQP